MAERIRGLLVLKPPQTVPNWVETYGLPTVDIVMVHGLNGDRLSTWSEGSVMWPRDLLPYKLPNARIMTFGYNADLVNNFSTFGIRDHAKKLLTSLRDKREEQNELTRPIIFCHSLGGITVKQALLTATIDKTYTLIARHTSGIVFLGTPHRGSNLASWGSLLANIAKVAFLSPKKDLIEDLKKNSKILSDISEDFTRIVSDYSIKSFYEENKFRGIAVIVEKDSAVMKITQEEAIPIEGHHMEISKFSGDEDGRFEAVWKAIRRLIPNAAPQRMQISAVTAMLMVCILINLSTASLTSQQLAFLSGLPGPDMDDCLEDIEDPFPNTFRWILANRHLLDWLALRESAVLHIVGQPGCGKSVLSAFLLRKAFRNAFNSSVFYFSFQDQEGRRSASSAWASLVYQILAHDPALFTKISGKPKEQQRIIVPQNAKPWKEQELRQTFERLSGCCRLQSIYIVDGLDHCDDTLDKFLQAFSAAMGRSGNPCIKLLALSRPRPNILPRPKFPLLAQIDLDEEEGQKRDVRYFIESGVMQLIDHRPGYEAFRSEITEQLCGRAHGMYLLPALILKDLASLRKSTTGDIEAALKALPKTLFAAYRQTLDNIQTEDRALAGNVLMWVVFGVRPLDICELSSASVINASISSIYDLKRQTRVDIARDGGMRQLLGPLLKLSNRGVVQLVHYSVMEFFLYSGCNHDHDSDSQLPDWVAQVFCRLPSENHNRSRGLPDDPQRENSVLTNGHKTLARLCETYLGLVTPLAQPLIVPRLSEGLRLSLQGGAQIPTDNFGSFDSLFNSYPLLGYAVDSVAEHVRQVAGDDPDTREFHLEFGSFLAGASGQAWEILYWSRHDPWQQFMGHRPLHLASVLGLLETLRILVHSFDLEERNGYGSTALDVAASTGRTDIINVLHNAGADINALQNEGGTPLHTAAWYGYKEAVKHLLRLGANFSIRDKNGCRALEVAAEAGSHAVILVLLEHRGLLNPERRKWTALHAASRAGRLETVKTLVRLGANPHAMDERGRTPLHIASLVGQKSCLEYFLDIEASIGAIDDEGCHALHLAAMAGSEAIIALLLGRNTVDINIIDKKCRNAFHYACLFGRTGAAKLLASLGININKTDIDGHTAFHSIFLNNYGCSTDTELSEALQPPKSYLEMGQVILNLGADIKSQDNEGRNALHIAAANPHSDIDILLDEDIDISINEQDDEGQTALHILANSYRMAGQRAIVETLIHKGANTNLRDNLGRSVLQRNLEKGYSSGVIELLLDSGADPNCGHGDCTELFCGAVKRRKEEIARALLRYGGKLDPEKLVVDVNAGEVLVYLAKEGGHDAFIQLLMEKLDQPRLEKGLLRAVLERQSTAIESFSTRLPEGVRNKLFKDRVITAAQTGDLESIKLFVEKVLIQIDLTDDKFQQTALSHVAENDRKAVVEYLLDRGASLEIPDRQGRKALWWAAREGKSEIVDMLLARGAVLSSSIHSVAREYHHEGVLKLLQEWEHLRPDVGSQLS